MTISGIRFFSGGNKSGLELRYWWWLYNFVDIWKSTELYTLKGEFYGIYIQRERKKKRFLKFTYWNFFRPPKWRVLPPWSGSFNCPRTGFFPLLFHLALRQLSLQIPEGSFILSMTSQTFGIPELWAEVSCWLTVNKPWTDF